MIGGKYFGVDGGGLGFVFEKMGKKIGLVQGVQVDGLNVGCCSVGQWQIVDIGQYQVWFQLVQEMCFFGNLGWLVGMGLMIDGSVGRQVDVCGIDYCIVEIGVGFD